MPTRNLMNVTLIVTALLLFTAVSLLYLLFAAAPAYADGNIIYVDRTAPNAADQPACGTTTIPCRSIQYALTQRAQPGVRLLVAGAIYTEPLTVTVPGVQIEWDGVGQTMPTIDGENARGPLVTFAPGLTGTTVLSGFVVQNGITATGSSGAGIVVDASSPTLQIVRVWHNAGDGITLLGNASPLVQGSTLCANSGFQLNNGGTNVVEAMGNWWGTNSPLAGQTVTGTVTTTLPISVELQLAQVPGGGTELLGSGSLVTGLPAVVTATMRGGGFNALPGTVLTLTAAGGYFGGGVTNTVLLLENGVATTAFTPTGAHSAVIWAFHPCQPAQPVATLDYNYHIFLPLVLKNYPPPPPEPTCPTTSARNYNLIPVPAPPADHPDYLHGDLNLSLRGYEPVTGATLALVDISGNTDGNSPQFPGLFVDGRLPKFTAAYQVYNWDWGCGADGCRGNLLNQWEVTLLGMETTPGEAIRIPTRGPDIYQGTYRALVLYAEEKRITLVYAREDTVAYAYAVHIENVCVDPNLLSLYRSRVDSSGWRISNGGYQLPALDNGQTLGTALNTEILVAIRDKGSFMDPRSRKDWWWGK